MTLNEVTGVDGYSTYNYYEICVRHNLLCSNNLVFEGQKILHLTLSHAGHLQARSNKMYCEFYTP